MSAERQYLQGVAVAVFDRGVLITGQSGSGKTELALQLLDRGHRLVADDSVPVMRVDGELYADGGDPATDFVALRNLGVLDVVRTFGAAARARHQRLDLAVRLVRGRRGAHRQNPQGDWRELGIMGTVLPELRLDTSGGRPLALLVECAVREHSRPGGGDPAWCRLAAHLRRMMDDAS